MEEGPQECEQEQGWASESWGQRASEGAWEGCDSSRRWSSWPTGGKLVVGNGRPVGPCRGEVVHWGLTWGFDGDIVGSKM